MSVPTQLAASLKPAPISLPSPPLHGSWSSQSTNDFHGAKSRPLLSLHLTCLSGAFDTYNDSLLIELLSSLGS